MRFGADAATLDKDILADLDRDVPEISSDKLTVPFRLEKGKVKLRKKVHVI